MIAAHVYRSLMPKRRDSGVPAGKTKPVRFSYSTADQPKLQQVVIQAIEKIGGQRKLKKLYVQHQKSVAEGENFFAAALRLLRITVEFDQAALAQTPARGLCCSFPIIPMACSTASP